MLRGPSRQPHALPEVVAGICRQRRRLSPMNFLRRSLLSVGVLLVFATVAWAVPVPVSPVLARRGVVVAGHPQAAEAGVNVLRSGGNAIDASIATSLAL